VHTNRANIYNKKAFNLNGGKFARLSHHQCHGSVTSSLCLHAANSSFQIAFHVSESVAVHELQPYIAEFKCHL